MLPYRDSRFVRIAFLAFFLAVGAYALFEARGFLTGPIIYVPEEKITVNEPFTSIRGRAERIIELRLNGKVITVTENGEFEEPHLLSEGSNRLILEARDARGRTTQKILTVTYLPPYGQRVPAVVPSTLENATSSSS